MASGVLGQVSLASTTYTTVYTVPSATLAYANVNISNRNSSDISVRVALASTATPTNAEFIEYDSFIAPNGVLERTGLVLESGKRIVVYSNSSNVSASAYGVEQSTL
jgi:hypothetical protein